VLTGKAVIIVAADARTALATLPAILLMPASCDSILAGGIIKKQSFAFSGCAGWSILQAMRTHRNPRETCVLPPSNGGGYAVALCFPGTYYVGMSNLGFQAVYRILRGIPGVTCERAFLPANQALHGRAGQDGLCSFGNGRPLRSFDALAFSLSFENEYSNIVSMLSLGRIPLKTAERSERDPLVFAGGVATFLNPEPLADTFDFFILGEAEGVLEQCLEVLLSSRPGGGSGKPAAAACKNIPGVYIPAAYDIRYADSGTIAGVTPAPGFPPSVSCVHAEKLNSIAASSCFITPDTEFSDMALVEVSRGCPRGCRFCAVGSVYRPFRTRELSALTDEIRPLTDCGTKIGLLGAAVSDYPQLEELLQSIIAAGGQVSVSSLRADALTDGIVQHLKGCGHRTFTIAPEAGSERLRRVIGKNMSGDAIFKAARMLARHRIPAIKLYFMIGLPTEGQEDVEAIVHLTREIKHAYYKEAGGEKWLNRIQLSISPFVPKPWTPFQWHPYDQVAVLKQKIKAVVRGLKKERKVAVHYDLPKWGYVQTLLSRGDRRTGGILVRAFENGGDWTRAFMQTDVNPDFYVYRERGPDEMFPWDFIRHSTGKDALWKEYRRAMENK